MGARKAEFKRLVDAYYSAGDRREWDATTQAEKALRDFGAVWNEAGTGWIDPQAEPDSVMIWKCTGRLYNERDTSWMWVDYRQSRASAMAACEAQALGNNEGVLTWEEETDEYSRATTEKRHGWIYELELIEVKA